MALMEVIEGIDDMREKVAYLKKQRRSNGFVPTMGALHDGHLELVKRSIAANHTTTVSIFINKTQFNNEHDFVNYPQSLVEDLERLKEVNCDCVFTPKSKEIYAENPKTTFRFDNLDNTLEGAHRPGHFSGVALIVAKLLNLVQPDNLYLGLKDYQQYLIVSQLVKDLNFPTNVVGIPTVRDENGLALSSRNKRLSQDERIYAGKIYEALKMAQQVLVNGKSIAEVKELVTRFFQPFDLITLEYFEIVDKDDLSAIDNINSKRFVLACIACYIGKVRLIDNLIIELK